jgi:hypothetical protein
LEIAAATGTEFARQQSHQGQSRPLAHTERPQQLLLGMLEGEADCVYGRNRHERTSLGRELDRSKVLRTGNQVNGFVAGDSLFPGSL